MSWVSDSKSKGLWWNLLEGAVRMTAASWGPVRVRREEEAELV